QIGEDCRALEFHVERTATRTEPWLREMQMDFVAAVRDSEVVLEYRRCRRGIVSSGGVESRIARAGYGMARGVHSSRVVAGVGAPHVACGICVRSATRFHTYRDEGAADTRRRGSYVRVRRWVAGIIECSHAISVRGQWCQGAVHEAGCGARCYLRE